MHMQEGASLLEGEELEKTRAQTAASKTEVESPTTPSKVKRTTTIFQTTEVCVSAVLTKS